MIARPRAVLATASVVFVVLVDVVATMLVQHGTQVLFVLCSVAAAAAAIQTAARNPAALPWVLLFGLPL